MNCRAIGMGPNIGTNVPPNTKICREVMEYELEAMDIVGAASRVAEVPEHKDSAHWAPIMVTMPA